MAAQLTHNVPLCHLLPTPFDRTLPFPFLLMSNLMDSLYAEIHPHHDFLLLSVPICSVFAKTLAFSRSVLYGD